MQAPARTAGGVVDAAAAPTLEQVRALAYAALLDHARRSDHAHALATLMRALAALVGAECWLWPQPPGDELAMPPIHARPSVHAPASPRRESVQTAWPCSHSGIVVGELRTPLPAGLEADEWGARLLPARDTAAALLAGLIEHAGHALPGSLALQRTAMHEAGTYVWEWDIVTDVLGDIAEGERLLGYPLNTLGHTQADWDRVIHPDDRAQIDAAFEARSRCTGRSTAPAPPTASGAGSRNAAASSSGIAGAARCACSARRATRRCCASWNRRNATASPPRPPTARRRCSCRASATSCARR
jgi:hypothetical protein